MLDLYQKEKINPFSGCLIVLLQLPFLVTLYYVAINSVKPELVQQALYGFVANPGVLTPTIFWVFDLNNQGVLAGLALIAGALQFWQARASIQKQAAPNPSGAQGDIAKMMQKQMVYIFPVISVILVWQLKGIVGVYWALSSLFALIEQKIIYQKKKNVK
jgi:YidC/Oxa1 family membrane protein insertase